MKPEVIFIKQKKKKTWLDVILSFAIILVPILITLIFIQKKELDDIKKSDDSNICTGIDPNSDNYLRCKNFVISWKSDRHFIQSILANNTYSIMQHNSSENEDEKPLDDKQKNESAFFNALLLMNEVQLLKLNTKLPEKYMNLTYTDKYISLIKDRLKELQTTMLRKPDENPQEFIKRTQCL